MKRRIRIKIREERTHQAPADRFEQLLESVGSAEVLSEGLWSKVKYLVGKAGSIRKGGSIFGRGKKAKKAQEFIDNVIEKKGREFIKKLDSEIRQNHPEFPNQEDKFDFQNAAASILAVYWSIVAAAGQCGDGGVDCGEGAENLKPGDEGYLDVSLANEIIKDLESYAKYIADYKLAYSYKRFTEGKSLHSKIPLTIQEAQRLDELFGLSSKEKMAKAVAASERGEDEDDYEGSDAQRDALFNKGKKTSSWKVLESNLLPGVLTLLGGGFTLAHLIAPYVLPQPGTIETITKKQHLKATIDFVTTNGDALSATAAKNSSLTGFVANLSGAPGNAGTMGEFANQIKSIATTTGQPVGNITSAISEGLKMPSADAAKMMHFMHDFGVANPTVGYGQIVNATAPHQQFVNFVANTDPSFASTISSGASGAGTLKGGLTNVLGINPGAVTVAGAAITKAIISFYTVTTITKGAVAAVPGGATAIAGSGALLTIGVSLFAVAAAVKLLRMKGKHSSRLKVLQDIVNQINPIEERPGKDTDPDPVIDEYCIAQVKKMYREFKVGDFVMYEERYDMSSSSGRDADTSPAVITDLLITEVGSMEEQIDDPKNNWPEGSEKDENPFPPMGNDGEDLGLKADKDGKVISEADPDKGGKQSTDFSGKEQTHRIYWQIRNYNIRDAKRRGLNPTEGTVVAAPVFRKEGDGECRPYIRKISEEEFKEQLTKVADMAARHHQVAATKKIENPESYINPEADSKVYQDVGKLHSNTLDEDMVDNYKNLGRKVKAGNVTEELKDIFSRDSEELQEDAKELKGYFEKLNIPRPDKNPDTRAYKMLNKYMIVAAHIMARHIRDLEKEIKQGLTSKAAAKIEINKDSIELTVDEFKKSILSKRSLSPRDKSLHPEILKLFKRAKLIESDAAEADRRAEEKLDGAWRKQRQLFRTRCSAAHAEKDADSKRKYCKSVYSKVSRDFTLDDYKEYLKKREGGEIKKTMKFWQYVVANDLGLEKPAAKRKKTSESIVQRWKELAGIIKG